MTWTWYYDKAVKYESTERHYMEALIKNHFKTRPKPLVITDCQIPWSLQARFRVYIMQGSTIIAHAMASDKHDDTEVYISAVQYTTPAIGQMATQQLIRYMLEHGDTSRVRYCAGYDGLQDLVKFEEWLEPLPFSCSTFASYYYRQKNPICT